MMVQVIWSTAALAVLLAACLLLSHGDDSLVVKTSTGLVRGNLSAINNLTYTSFLGIPYAKPPIGALRFSKPQMIDSWTHIHNAYEYGPDCMPGFNWPIPYNQSEDCLFLNVWVPGAISRDPRPVIVYIHGGGFVGGNGRFPGDFYAVQSNAIVVSLNYRLNSFGFLNLYVEEAPGNMGLFDQRVAMTWVKTNIEAFGGDCNRITIMGMSAGGASVGYHLISPKSYDLYNQGITHSGSPTGYWAFDSKVSTTIKAMELAEMVQCNRSDVILNPKRLVECLKQVSAEDLNKMSMNLKLIRPMTFSFVPTIDGDFLPATPHELLSQGKIKKTRVIVGTNRNEGSGFLYFYFPDYFKKGLLNMDQVIDITQKAYPDLSRAQLAKVHRQYFGSIDPNNTLEDTKKAADMLGDHAFLCSSNFLAEKLTKFGGKAYYSHFVYARPGSWYGAMHVTDFFYADGEMQNQARRNEAEKTLSKRMVAQWASFIKFGNPSTADYKWPVYNEQSRKYYKVDMSPPVTAERGPRASFCKFWDDIDKVEQPTAEPTTVA